MNGINSQPLWVLFAVASIPAMAAIIAAFVAGGYAKAAKANEIEAQRLRDLESRISDRKYETYKPMVALLGDMLNKDKSTDLLASGEIPSKLHDFTTWASIYSSDEAVRAFRNLMQSTYVDAPKEIVLRLYCDFVLEARRDIGRPDTSTSSEELLAMRLTDIYASDGLKWIVSEPFDEVCKRAGWSPPWIDAGRARRTRQ
ncbi:hypothetical protein [Actinoplanes sp. HUAS TT8]|uniref:hypothetical protein n=1 Tax=Actinoplanes sp. HUAS TT8 TaxID=3447453 RepID=UPI003F5247D9